MTYDARVFSRRTREANEWCFPKTARPPYFSLKKNALSPLGRCI